MSRRFLFSLLALGALSLVSSDAQAGWYGWGGLWPNGYSIYTSDYVPYFARNPPVYYHFPTYYRYGRSPFPALPACGECDSARSQHASAPLIVVNHYATAGVTETASPAPAPAPAKVSNNAVAVKPLRVQNPFFTRDEVAAKP